MSRMSTRLASILAPISLALVFAIAWGQDESKEKSKTDEKSTAKLDPAMVRKLVDQLKSSDFKTRDTATKALSKLDEVPDALYQATKTGDVESRRRARVVIDDIGSRLVEQLKSDDFLTREIGTIKLAAFEEVPSGLRAAAKSSDAEVRGRASSLIKSITARLEAKR